MGNRRRLRDRRHPSDDGRGHCDGTHGVRACASADDIRLSQRCEDGLRFLSLEGILGDDFLEHRKVLAASGPDDVDDVAAIADRREPGATD